MTPLGLSKQPNVPRLHQDLVVLSENVAALRSGLRLPLPHLHQSRAAYSIPRRHKRND
jgi:hypothetical protein